MVIRFGSSSVALLYAAALLGVGASSAHAHIKLLKPASWIVEDETGDPQKTGPCGNSGTPTNMITTFQAGETIEVEWQETIGHPGHFRIALAKDRSEFKDPEVETDGFCNYEPGSISDIAVPPVLADNLFPRTEAPLGGRPEPFKTTIKLPDEPCEKCTLQLIQYMTVHPEPCIYYHCADIRIVAPGSGNAGASGGAAGAAGGAAGATAGAGASGTSGGAAGMTSSAAGASGGTGLPAPGGSGGSTSVGMTTGGSPAGAPPPNASPAGAGAPPTGPASAGSDESGCAAGGRAGTQGLLSVALATLLIGVRRRRVRR